MCLHVNTQLFYDLKLNHISQMASCIETEGWFKWQLVVTCPPNELKAEEKSL